MEQAVIVAAGLSSRLYPLTKDKPKCLLQINGQTIIERNVKLLQSAGINKIFVVTGYMNEKIESVIRGSATCIYNPFYDSCNNMGSLFMAKSYVGDKPFIYMHGDIVFTEKLLMDFLTEAKRKAVDINLSVDFKETDEEAMKVKVSEDKSLIESSKEISLNESAGEWTGLSIINNNSATFEEIKKVLQERKLNVYDTFAFNRMVQSGHMITCHPTKKEKWVEIDFVEDYDKAKRMFE